MTNRERKLGIATLAVFVVWLMFYFSPRGKTTKPVADTRPGVAVKAPQPAGAAKEVRPSFDLKTTMDLVKLSELTPEKSFTPDPFEKFPPAAVPSDSAGNETLSLSGIILEGDEPLALINDQIFKKGESILGYKIERIEQNEVVLTNGVEKKTLKLFQE